MKEPMPDRQPWTKDKCLFCPEVVGEVRLVCDSCRARFGLPPLYSDRNVLRERITWALGVGNGCRRRTARDVAEVLAVSGKRIGPVLAAMRRDGIVERRRDGVWLVKER